MSPARPMHVFGAAKTLQARASKENERRRISESSKGWRVEERLYGPKDPLLYTLTSTYVA
ncbi:hypothetical protein FRB91_010915, partial [Serendipita sp. 411]